MQCLLVGYTIDNVTVHYYDAKGLFGYGKYMWHVIYSIASYAKALHIATITYIYLLVIRQFMYI